MKVVRMTIEEMEYIERSMSMWFRPLPAKTALERDRPIVPVVTTTAKRKPKPTSKHGHTGKTAKTTEFHHKALLQCNTNAVRPLTAPPETSSRPGFCEAKQETDTVDDPGSKLHILDRVVGNLQTLLSEMRNYNVFEPHRDSSVVEKIERIDISTPVIGDKCKKNINNNNSPTLRFIKRKRNSAKQYFKHVSKLGSLRRNADKDDISKKNDKPELLFEQTPMYAEKYSRRGRNISNLCTAPPVPQRTLSASPVNTLNTDRLSAMSVCRFPKSESLWRAVVLREHRKKCQNRLSELEEEARILKYAIYSKCS